jgi:hypothetical protein
MEAVGELAPNSFISNYLALNTNEIRCQVCRVHEAALVEEQNGKMLAIPTFILRDKTARERRREMYASTYAQFRRRW